MTACSGKLSLCLPFRTKGKSGPAEMPSTADEGICFLKINQAALAISPDQARWWDELGIALVLRAEMDAAGNAF